MTDLSDLFYGKEAAATLKAFYADIDEIATKYKDELDENDSVSKHIVFSYHAGFSQFGFNEEDKKPLPDYIKAECVAVFQKHFPSARKI